MGNKILITFLFIYLLSSCEKKIDDIQHSEIKKEINLNNIINSIEISSYLNNEFKINFGIVDRGNGILTVFTNYASTFICKKVQNNILDTLWTLDNNNKGLNEINLKKIINLSNLLVKFCTENYILSINFSDLFQEHYSDSNIFIITTLKFDSTLTQLIQADSSFYDNELYIHDNPHYLYTLIFKVKDTIDSQEFLDIKQNHTIRKIKPNWYYYRSYKISDRIKMDYFLTKKD